MTTDECQYCREDVPANVVVTFTEPGMSEDVGACWEHLEDVPINSGVRIVDTAKEVKAICDRITTIARILDEDEGLGWMQRIIDHIESPDGVPC